MNKITVSRSDFINFMCLHETYAVSPDERELWELHWGVKYDLLSKYVQKHNPSIINKIKNLVNKYFFYFLSKK